jgi:hypothetical protein
MWATMSAVLEALHVLIPASQTSIKTNWHLTADSVLSCLRLLGCNTHLTPVPEFDSQQLSDDDIAKVVFSGFEEFHQSELLIHSPACSRHSLEDFRCSASELSLFIRNYQIEMLFSGDVIFVAPASKTITVFHDEGYFGHFNLRNQPVCGLT